MKDKIPTKWISEKLDALRAYLTSAERAGSKTVDREQLVIMLGACLSDPETTTFEPPGYWFTYGRPTDWLLCRVCQNAFRWLRSDTKLPPFCPHCGRMNEEVFAERRSGKDRRGRLSIHRFTSGSDPIVAVLMDHRHGPRRAADKVNR